LSIATTEHSGASSLLTLLIMQGGLGLGAGMLGGMAIRWLINNAGIEHEGLYGVLLIGLVICLFATTSLVGGSGFLAVYVAGLYLNNVDLLHKGSVIRFMDGIAWLAQIAVFLTL